jgi:hypothetical protein
LERRSVVEEEGFQGLAEVLDEMEAVDDLHRLGRPPADAVGVEVAPITADHGDGGMLGQPGRDAGGRAVRQQVHDPVIREIHQDRAVTVPPAPRPPVDPDGLQRGGVGPRGRPHQPEQRGWTGGELQAGRQSHAGLAAEGDTERL